MGDIREILIVPHTHHDIGYTHVPDVCMYMHERAIDEIIALCARGTDHAPDSFRWTMEISRPVVEWLRRATPAQAAQLQALVQRGRIALTGAYAHMTQLVGHEEYIRFFAPVRRLRDDYGLPVSVVQHGDINGLSWGVVPLMRDMRLETLVMALNPDHGRAPFEQPSAFWWEGQDGSRVLVWLSLFYSLANNPWRLTAGEIENAIEPLRLLIDRLNQRDDYPFDFAVIHSAEDNMLPNDKICDAVRRWNSSNRQPPMRIATIDQAIQRAHAQAEGAALPTVRGEWADWWAHGHGSTAYEVGLSRLARAEVRAADVAQTLARLSGQKTETLQLYDLPIVNWYRVSNLPLSRHDFQTRVDQVYDLLLLFEEHTWGTFETVTHPHSLFTRTHWEHKAEFAYHAVSEAHNLARESLTDLAAALPAGESLSVVAVNPLSVARDELVTVRTPGVNHTVLVRHVPPLGARVVEWDADAFDAKTEIEPSVMVENDFYRLTVDAVEGSVISLIDKATGREWVDSVQGGLGAVVWEEPAPEEDHPALTQGRHHFHPNHPGPRFTYTRIQADLPHRVYRTHYGTVIEMETYSRLLPRIQTSVILHDSMNAVDFTLTLDKLENYAMEGVYVQFPFALHPAAFWLETANAVYKADDEQLPDSCRDWYSIQHGVGITDGTASVLWATREAPLIQIGGCHTGRWRRTLGEVPGHLNAWLMNNLYFTNFKAAQGGRMQVSFRLTTQDGAVNPAQVRAFGEAFANPPLARVAQVQPGSYQWLTIEPDTVQAQILKPAADSASTGDFILRLKECAGQPTLARITWHGVRPVQFRHTDLLETASGDMLPQDGVPHGVDTFLLAMQPHELVTLRGSGE
ncbi:MAG: hypothetical protein SF029_05795 [bacterium]|nr:hypothetical protein [bacterium]